MLRKVNSLLSFVLIALMVLLIAPRPAYACSCVELPPVQQALDRSTAVFTGTVIERDDFNAGLFRSSADPIRVTFQVTDVWKGEIRERTTITTAMDGASCGYDFQAGHDYLVYAHEGENGLTVSLCSRTTSLSRAAEDLAVLGAGTAPLAGSTGPSTGLNLNLLLLGACGAAVLLFLLLAAVILLVVRRRRTA